MIITEGPKRVKIRGENCQYFSGKMGYLALRLGFVSQNRIEKKWEQD